MEINKMCMQDLAEDSVTNHRCCYNEDKYPYKED